MEEISMSKCAALFTKWAVAARSRDQIRRGERKRVGRLDDYQTFGAETTADHYRAAYLAAQLIAGTYTA
jgi:hypothetical protein